MEQPLQAIVNDAIGPIKSAGPAQHAPIHTLPDGEARHRRQILLHLDTYPPPPHDKSLHMGVAGYFNFDIAAKTRPSYILLMDCNENQTRFWTELFTLLKDNQSLDDFKDALAQRTVQQGFLCGDGTLLEKRLGSGNAMLGLEALTREGVYDYLHTLAQKGRLACTTINLIKDKEKSQVIGRALRGDGFRIDTAYWANIGSFFHPTRGVSLRSKEDDVFGQEPHEHFGQGLHYKDIGFYKNDALNIQAWQGYGSQEERDAITDEHVPAYERFLENTSALAGLHTVHMHAHASDKIRHIHRYKLILSEGPLRRLPEQIEARKNGRNPEHPDWQIRISDETEVSENKPSR